MTKPLTDQQLDEITRMPRAEDIDVLVAEVRRLRAELAAVTNLCDEQEMAARVFELPTPEWIAAVRNAIAPAARSAAV